MLILVQVSAGQNETHESYARELARLTVDSGVLDLFRAQLTEILSRGAAEQIGQDLNESEREAVERAVADAFQRIYPRETWVEATFPVYMLSRPRWVA